MASDDVASQRQRGASEIATGRTTCEGCRMHPLATAARRLRDRDLRCRLATAARRLRDRDAEHYGVAVRTVDARNGSAAPQRSRHAQSHTWLPHVSVSQRQRGAYEITTAETGVFVARN